MTTAKRRTKGAGSVFKDGRGLWHFRKEITPDPRTGGRRIIEVTGKVKADARTRFEAKVAQYERTGVIRTTKGPTMGGYAERWMQSHRRHVKPTTYSNEIGWVRTMCAHIGGIRVTELKPSDIQTMIDDLLTTRKARTVNAYLSVLNCMLDDAEREDLIQTNPMRRIRTPKTRQYERPILDPEDPRKLIDTAKTALAGKDGPDEGEMWSLMFELAFSTGMRPGERYALMPRQLERRHGIPGINVCQQVQRYRGGKNASIPTWLNARHLCGDRWLTTTKTDKGKRFIPITEHLWDKLWNHIAKWGIDNNQLIFANTYGRPIDSEVESLRWHTALDKAGLPDVDMYSARHWLSTALAETGANDDERTTIMGHTSISTTSIYTHWSTQALHNAMTLATDIIQ